MLRAATRQAPPVDIDQLEPPTSDDRANTGGNSTATPSALDENSGDQFTFDNATNSWVRKSSLTTTKNQNEANATTPDVNSTPSSSDSRDSADSGNSQLRVVQNAQDKKNKRNQKNNQIQNVIEISYIKLVRGDPTLNIIIKPGDTIYCDSGEVGVVYIDGEIARPGVYNLPTSGRLTLSRLVAAAGGVSELAIPERCDLIRRLGSDKEACVRISLGAIRNRGEPDIFLKPDDHVIVGTNFWALPLARFRRDLSFPNSVGFQLDRNFGNDVFGAPPSGITTN
ncbi:MAG: hypothetical protein EXS12_07115 [Phycisphaerales bacterium]|nr:hypothetical protein [Phycisphaerales bacterium]